MSEVTDAQCLNGSSDQESGMVAYLVLAHAADEQLRLLTNELLSDRRSKVYLHLDAKVFDLGWIEVYGSPRLVLLSDRRGINWAGYSIVDVTLRLLQTALLESSNKRFVLLSGACFPLKPQREINEYITSITSPWISIWGRIDSTLKHGESMGRYVVTKFYPYDNRFLRGGRLCLNTVLLSISGSSAGLSDSIPASGPRTRRA
jgi:hypothetical protein